MAQKNYIMFTNIMNRPKIEKTIFLRLTNSEKDNENEKEEKFSQI